MSDIIKFPGNKVGSQLIRATINRMQPPLTVAAQCRTELRGVLRKVGDGKLQRELPNATFNHARMLKRVAEVEATHTALLPVVYPNIVRSAAINGPEAITMLAVLFGALGKKSTDNETLMRACIAMFDPITDEIGAATGLWTPVSHHPFVLAMAISKLVFNSVFTSVAELRAAMTEARNSVMWLMQETERWLELLKISDKTVFEFDRPAWDAAYANIGADIIALMQDRCEEPFDGDDDDEPEPGTPRWLALEAMRRAKS